MFYTAPFREIHFRCVVARNPFYTAPLRLPLHLPCIWRDLRSARKFQVRSARDPFFFAPLRRCARFSFRSAIARNEFFISHGGHGAHGVNFIFYSQLTTHTSTGSTCLPAFICYSSPTVRSAQATFTPHASRLTIHASRLTTHVFCVSPHCLLHSQLTIHNSPLFTLHLHQAIRRIRSFNHRHLCFRPID